MWELGYKESWVPKNWCFWTAVLEKTLESPLDCKEIQPVHPKGDQSRVFTGRTDVEAETPILWPPDAKSWLIWKDPDAGKDWGKEEKGTTEDEMVGCITDSMDTSLDKLRELGMDRLDFLAVQGTLKSLLQHYSSNTKPSILQCSAFFTVQLSHPYMTTGKTIALTRWTFVDKVMSLLLNMLSRLVITFLPRSKFLLISWLQSQAAVILEPPQIKSATV